MGKRNYRFDFFLFCLFAFFAFHFFADDDMFRIHCAQRTFAYFSTFQGHFYSAPDIARVLPVLHQRSAHARRGNLQGVAFAKPVVLVNILLEIPTNMLALFEGYPGIGINEHFYFVIGTEFDFKEETVGEGLFLEFFRK